VQLIDIVIDNRISCSFIESSSIENVIFCRPLEESLDNVSIISTKDNEFIHSYIQESTNNYLETDIQLPDGRVYPNVRFKLVAVENGRELPQSTINLSLLGSHSSISEQTTLPNFIEEGYEFTVDNEKDIEGSSDELQTIPVPEDVSEYVEKVKSYEAHLIEEQARIKAEAQRLNRERIVLEDDRRIQKTLEDYKSELLHETFRISEQQKELLEQAINEAVASIQGQFDDQQINVGKYLETLSSANLEEVKKYQDNQVNEIKSSINSLLAERLEQASVENDKLLLERASELEAVFTEKIITELEEHKRGISSEIDTITKSLDVIVTEKITSNNDNVDVLLVNRAGILQDQFSEKVATDLAEYKDNLSREFKASSTETASRIFSDKTKELNEAVAVLLDEHKQNLNNTITDKLNTVGYSIDKFKSEVDGKLPELNNTIKDINKKIQSLVTEKKNVQLLVDDARKYTDSKVAKVSEEVMAYARRILELGGGGGSNAVQYANGGTMNGDLNVTGQYLSGGISLFNILSGAGGGAGNPDVNALVISASANWNTAYESTTALNLSSGNWNSAYTSWNSTSATLATIAFTDSKYLPLSGGTLTDSIGINNNPLYFNIDSANIGNSYGDFGIGSSNDILINPNSNLILTQNVGNVGIGTTTPTTKLDVNGTITATGGNSDQWNETYTTYTANSASYATYGFVNTNFFNLTGGTISGETRINNNLTVFGNLTATGTTTFANTVFTTTSALSVVHIGSGPAMYVGNNGDGDIASFYDIDQNVEVLHVGGINSSFPNVGVKTSSPNKTLTVVGEISATSNITTTGTIEAAILKISSAPATFINPLTASNSFLVINVNGVDKALQLWDFTS
jgi:dsDNA-binding SOS-regulon protein